MKHTFYARNDIHVGKTHVPAGEVLVTLEAADGLPVDGLVRALHNGLATQNKPEPKAKPDEQATAAVAPAAPPVAKS
jgi:pyruvate/2-oxoglutarate dehydrogenase complex dihydrolipoamide acyltransferase (E2) component